MVMRRVNLADIENRDDRQRSLRLRVEEAMRAPRAEIGDVLELAREVLDSDLLSPAERERFIAELARETGVDLRAPEGPAGASRARAADLARDIARDARPDALREASPEVASANRAEQGRESGPSSGSAPGSSGLSSGSAPGSSARRALTDVLGRLARQLAQPAPERASGPQVRDAVGPEGRLAEGALERQAREAVAAAVARYAPQFSLDPARIEVELGQGAPGEGRLGLMRDGVISLDASKVDARAPEGRAVIAHELAHVAQREAAAPVIARPEARIGRAEREADAVFGAALRGAPLPAPKTPLAASDEAACGPLAMNENRGGGGGGGGGGDRPQPQPQPPEPPPQPRPEPQPQPPEPDPAGGGDCLRCPDPDPEHASVNPIRPFDPRPTQPGQRELDLQIAGRRLRLLIPDGTAAGEVRVELQDRDSPFTALKLRRAVLRLDANMNIESGQIEAGVELGNYVRVDNVVLQVDREGQVGVHIRDCQVQVNEDIRARVDLTINNDGFSGAATVTAEQISLGPNYTIKDALLHVRIDPKGKVSAHGEVTLQVGDLFSVKLEACYVDGEWSGKLTFIWERDITLFPGCVLKQASITGCYHKDHWYIEGTAQLDVADHFNVNATLKYEWKVGEGGFWYFTGEVSQHTDLPVIEGVNLTEVRAFIEWKKDHWEPATFSAKLVHEYVQGTLSGTWDIAKNEVTAEGAVTLVKPLPLGIPGARMETGNVRAYLVKNKLTEIKGAVSFVMQLAGVDTFQVAADDLSYRFEDRKANGVVTATLLRDLNFGDPAGLNAKVNQGAQARATLVDNRFGGMQAGLAFSVNDAARPLGAGTITFELDERADFKGKAEFHLLDRWGIPAQETGPVFLLPGGSFELEVNNQTLGHCKAKDVQFEILQPAERGTGKIAGTFEGDFDFRTRLGNLRGTARVEQDWAVTSGPWGDLTLTPGGDVSVVVAQSRLTEARGKLPFRMNVAQTAATDAFTLNGELEGAYNPANQTVSGALSATLVTPLTIRMPSKPGHSFVLLPGTKVAATVTNNEPDTFTMELLGEYHDEQGLLLAGSITGARYNFRSGEFGCRGELVLKRELKRAIDGQANWSISALPELTRFDVTIAQNRLERAGGQIVVRLYEGEEPLLEGALNGEVTFEPELSFSGAAALRLVKRVAWPRPGAEGAPPPGYAFYLDQGSQVTAQVTNNTLDQAGVVLRFGVLKDGTELANGELTGDWTFRTNTFNLDGNVQLVRNWYFDGARAADNEKDMSRWRFGFERGSQVGFSIQNNAFQDATVNVSGILERGPHVVARGNITGQYRPGQEGGFNGAGTVALVRDVELGKAAGFDLVLGVGTSVNGTIQNSRLTSGTLQAIFLARQRAVDKMRLRIGLQWAGGSSFSGDAELEVLDAVQVGPTVNMRGKQYSVAIARGSTGRIGLQDNQLTRTSGAITIDIRQNREAFAQGNFSIDYDFQQPSLGVTAEGSLTMLKALDLGTAAGLKFSLEAGSTISGRLENNDLKWIDGSMRLGVAKGNGGKFGYLTLQGRYENAEIPKFNGAATAEIVAEYDLGAEARGYRFFLQPASGFTIVLEDSAFKSFDGRMGIIARQMRRGGRGGMQGDVAMLLQGRGVKEGRDWIFDGTASATVSGNIEVGTAGKYAFSIQGGTGISLTVVRNRFTQIEGTLNGKVTENRKDFLGFQCWVRYDAGETDADPGKVSAKGNCRLLGEKELFNRNGYKFSLLPTPGPTALIDVVDNEVKEVGGELAFRLENNNDARNPLRIKGFARGLYNNDSGMFSGEGDIRLESDLNFNLTPDGKTKIVLKAGSGGNTAIENNQLQRLGGTLKGELWTDGRPLVGLNAEGTYNAVTNVLERFEGSATLLRDLTMGPAANPSFIIHQGLSANILIVNNALQRLEANNGRLSVPALNLQGGFDYLRYSCESGRDEYEAKGWIQVEMLKDQAQKGRYLRGRIDFQYNKDETWAADGTVDLRVNHYIGGQVRAHLDQTLDPKLGGTLNVGPAAVMQGRELFKKQLKLFSMAMRFAAGPVPISLNVGAEGSLGVDMLPLTMSGSISFDNFFPKRMSAPIFTNAQAQMNWGLRIKAAVMAYADARVDVAVASLGLGALGFAEVSGDALVNGGVNLNSDGSKYWGELNLGVSFAPTARVGIKPYVVAGLAGEDFRHEFAGLSFDLGNLFKWEYGKTFKFGDQPQAPTENGQRTPATTAGVSTDTSRETSQAQAQQLSQPRTPAAPQARGGEPQMESGAQMAGEKKDQPKKSSGNSEVDQKMQMIGEIGEVSGAVSDIVSQIMTLISGAMLGPIAFVLVICWKWVTGDLGRLVQNVMKVIDFWGRYKNLIMPYLPEWWNNFIEFARNPSSALEKWWNADVYTRQAVAKGEHRNTPADVRGKMLENLFAGWAAEGDRRAIEALLEYSSGRGDMWAVIAAGGTTERALGNAWWRRGEYGGSKLQRLFIQNGGSYDS